MKTLIIIPTFDETKLLDLLNRLPQKYSILLIDDGSCNFEMTAFTLLKNVKLARHSINLGQGAALQTGLEIARILDPDYIITMDSDGQHNPNDIKRFIDHINKTGVDIVFGDRSQYTSTMPIIRRYVLKLGVLFNWFYTGIKLKDAHNGYRIMNRKAYNSINLYEPRMAHATEILDQVRIHNLSYCELDIKVDYTEYSMSKGQKNRNMFSILKSLIMRRL